MSALVPLAWLVLALLAATAILGVVAVMAWRRHPATGFPTTKVTTHIALQTTSIVLWTGFVVTSRPWVAWTTFAVITAGQVVGDLLMFASYRERHRRAEAVSYRAVAKDVLGFTRPVPAIHAITGALGWFTMLTVCVLVSLEP